LLLEDFGPAWPDGYRVRVEDLRAAKRMDALILDLLDYSRVTGRT
jgi:signal transduction histidine kinase